MYLLIVWEGRGESKKEEEDEEEEEEKENCLVKRCQVGRKEQETGTDLMRENNVKKERTTVWTD